MEAQLQSNGASNNSFRTQPSFESLQTPAGEDSNDLPKIKIKAPPPVKIRRVLETRIGEWQIVPKASEEAKPVEEISEDENAVYDEDDLSTFRLVQKEYPGSKPNLPEDPEEEEQAPPDMTSLFKKRKTANRATRKK